MSFDLSAIDLDALKVTTKDAILEGVEGLLEGAKEDLLAFGVAITSDLLEAKLKGLDDVVDQCLDQLKMVAELNRIRIVQATWAAVTKVIKAILSAVLAGVMSVVI